MRWRRPEARAAGVQRPRGGAADGGRECTEGSPWCTAPASRICLKRGEGDETTSGASWAAAESSRERDAVAAARLMRRRHLPANQVRARGGRTAHGTPSAAQSGGATGASAPPAARRVRDGTGAPHPGAAARRIGCRRNDVDGNSRLLPTAPPVPAPSWPPCAASAASLPARRAKHQVRSQP